MGGDAGTPDRFTVTVPARPGLVGTLRVFAAAVARHYGLADDLVEDVKLGVSEACTDPVEAGTGGDITLVIAAEEGGVACEITSRSWTTGTTAPTDLPDGVDPNVLERFQVLRALFADAERSERDGKVTVRFSTASREAA